ncbi:helix-turn-helix transcriptional regulator [Alicyclobacillus curvatus]|nr:helix-turn-helix transcriptional regulator [Alicyclobacillus curvatus]
MPRSRKQDTVEQFELQAVVQWLNTLRESHKLTQNDFANDIGVSTTYVNMLLNGKRKPSIQLMKRIADIFGEASGLREVLPRAYYSDTSPRRKPNSHVGLDVGSPISSIFHLLNQQSVISTGEFAIEEVDDTSLEPWGVRNPGFALCERVHATELIAGDLVVYGHTVARHWGFIHVIGSEAFVISPGSHLRERLKLTDSQWVQSGFYHLDVSQHLLKQSFEVLNVLKVRLMLGTAPNLRTPVLGHPGYQFLRPKDRLVVDQTITRFTEYAKGQIEYQPSQNRYTR